MQPAFFEQPSAYVALGDTGKKQPTIAVCMCPLSKVLPGPRQIHPGSGMAWGTCPSDQCDVDPSVPQNVLNRFGLMSSCSKPYN